MSNKNPIREIMERIKKQDIMNATPQELMYNKKVKNLVEALKEIAKSPKVKHYESRAIAILKDDAEVANKALAEWEAGNE